VLSTLSLALAAAALAAGATGTWSPCGFSMIGTLASTGPGGRRGSLTACATFTAGALLGGVVTFGGLSLAGAALHTAGHGWAAIAATAVAAAAALGEARGVRIVPQVRRQVPEGWRRTLPLPLAAGLYGALLGLGFTTFVLTLAVWALAGICLALGEPGLGLAVGVAFGAGRALPVAVLAPLADREAGVRALQAMAERPAVLRGLRLADAAALAACALAIGAQRADAAVRVAAPGTDPSATPGALAWDVPGDGGRLRSGGRTVRLPGSDPAVWGRLVAWRVGDEVTVARRPGLDPLLRFRVPGVQKLALSRRWLVYRRARPRGGDTIAARRLREGSRERVLATVRRPAQLGRPSARGDSVVFHVARRGSTRIVLANLRTRRERMLRRGRRVLVLNPSLAGSRLLYVVVQRCRQELRLGRLGGRARTIVRLGGTGRRDRGHEPGHTSQGSGGRCPPGSPRPTSVLMWTTALLGRQAWLTRLRPLSNGGTRPAIVRVRA
jgi:hypothetical protein